MARSSAYGDILSQLPKWVMGGEYGDVSNLLASRDNQLEILRNNQIQNDRNELKLEEDKRRDDLDAQMRQMDIFKGDSGSQPTLRDMYGKVRDAASQLGSYEDVLKMQEKLDSLDRQRQQDELNKIYKESLIEAKNRSGSKNSGSSSKRLFQLENQDTGEKGVFLADEANQKLQEGWDFYDKNDISHVLNRGVKQPKNIPSEPGVLDRFVSGLLGSKPGEKESDQQKKIVEQIKTDATTLVSPSRPPRPGMKWQRNKKTGELREVPE